MRHYLIPQSLLILGHIRAKLAELHDLVESNLVKAAEQQKLHYDKRTKPSSFALNDKVWLSVPTAGKLKPKWEGGWRVKSVKSPVTVEISDGRRSKVVRSNRLQHWVQAMADGTESMVTESAILPWTPPQVEHFIEETVTSQSRYPSRTRRPSQFYRP